MGFIYDESKTTLINLAHIVTIQIVAPELAQKDYKVFCTTAGYGSYVLHSGNRDDCEVFLSDFHYFH